MVETPSRNIELGATAPEFKLPNTNPAHGGSVVALSDFTESKALLVLFICNHCPYVIHIAHVLVDIASKYQSRGLQTIAISVNDIEKYPQDSPEKMTEMARHYGFVFPYLYDESQQSAVDFGAVCTPDLFLFDGNQKLTYHGQCDDSRPGNSNPVTGFDLSQAIEQTLLGEPAAKAQKPSVGCNIKWKPELQT